MAIAKMCLLFSFLALPGCGVFQTVGDVECGAGPLNYCAAQLAAEARLNTWSDQAGSNTCVDLVHACPFAQCDFAGCQVEAEKGDWRVIQLPDHSVK